MSRHEAITGRLGTILGRLEGILGHFGGRGGLPGPSWIPLEALLGQLGALLGPSWAI